LIGPFSNFWNIGHSPIEASLQRFLLSFRSFVPPHVPNGVFNVFLICNHPRCTLMSIPICLAEHAHNCVCVCVSQISHVCHNMCSFSFIPYVLLNVFLSCSSPPTPF
jgi:hypothetical protein